LEVEETRSGNASVDWILISFGWYGFHPPVRRTHQLGGGGAAAALICKEHIHRHAIDEIVAKARKSKEE
jgi:hypothetical protein